MITKIRTYILGVFVITIVVSHLQYHFELIKVNSLNGAFVPPSKPDALSLSNWTSGKFQKQSEEFTASNFGFRPSFIRLSNQLRWSLFNELKNTIIRGENDFLFEKGYTASILGDDFIGHKRINAKIENLSLLQAQLQAKNKELLVILAPSKTRYHHDYLPLNEQKPIEERSGALTNRSQLISGMTERQIQFIDFQKVFDDSKDTTQYALYPKLGTHWSAFGATFAADSILNYFTHINQIETPRLIRKSIEVTTKPRITDSDLNLLLNLMFDLPSEQLAYPSFVIKHTDKKRIKILAIGDSYCKTFYDIKFLKQAFDDQSRFMFYNRTQMYLTGEEVPKSDSKEFEQLIEECDLVMFCYTEPNLKDFSHGFLRQYRDYTQLTQH